MATIKLSLPENITLLIKNDQLVDFNTDLFEAGSMTEVVIPLADKLKIHPSKIFKYLTKFVGEEIKKGETLAIKKNLLSQSEYSSEFSGIIKEINHENGSLKLLVNSGESHKRKSFFKGKIVSIDTADLTINISDGQTLPLSEAKDNFGGEIFYLNKQNEGSVTEQSVKDRIIVGDSISSYLQAKLEALGACGFVLVGSLPLLSSYFYARLRKIDDFSKIMNYNCRYCIILKKEEKAYFYNE